MWSRPIKLPISHWRRRRWKSIFGTVRVNRFMEVISTIRRRRVLSPQSHVDCRPFRAQSTSSEREDSSMNQVSTKATQNILMTLTNCTFFGILLFLKNLMAFFIYCILLFILLGTIDSRLSEGLYFSMNIRPYSVRVVDI